MFVLQENETRPSQSRKSCPMTFSFFLYRWKVLRSGETLFVNIKGEAWLATPSSKREIWLGKRNSSALEIMRKRRLNWMEKWENREINYHHHPGILLTFLNERKADLHVNFNSCEFPRLARLFASTFSWSKTTFPFPLNFEQIFSLSLW